MKRVFILAALALAVAVPAGVEAASYINYVVAIADPTTPANVLKPNADGSLNTTSTQAPASGAVTVTAATVGVSSAQALAAGTRKYLFVQNASLTASIACRADGGTAALNIAGSFQLPPLASRTWEGSATPNQALTCIASAASTPATIESQ